MSFTRRYIFHIIAFAAAVQTAIILYNNATGYIALGGIAAFLFRLAFGTVMSAPAALAIIMADEALVHRLDRSLEWETRFAARLSVEVVSAAAIGAVFGAAITVLVQQLAPYRDGLWKNIIGNAVITVVVNLIVIAVVEAVLSHTRTREAREKAEALERENSRIRFEVLKTQLDPHFMFNSLNVLSSLLRKDAERAERFIDAFASVYRYTLEVIELPVVELSRELEFARSYLYLLDIRFEHSVTVDVRIAGEHLDRLVPPLSLQTVLENAFKHNCVSEDAPLSIRIESADGWLTVTNNFQPKHGKRDSTGVGLSNLRKRYAFLEADEPRFDIVNNQFIASLPLIIAQ